MGSTVKQKRASARYDKAWKKIWIESGKEEVDLILQFLFFFFERGKPNCCTEFLCNVEIGYSNGPIHTLNHGFKVELLCGGSHLKTSTKKGFKTLHWVRVGWVHVGDESFDRRGTKATHCSHDPDLFLVFLFRFSSSTKEISQKDCNEWKRSARKNTRSSRENNARIRRVWKNELILFWWFSIEHKIINVVKHNGEVRT